jgi:hypothetical protein
VRLAAAELGGHVEDSRGLDGDSREPSHRLGGKILEVPGEECPLEEAPRILAVLRGSVIADVIQVDGELRGVQRTSFAKVFARWYEFLAGLQLGHFRSLSCLIENLPGKPIEFRACMSLNSASCQCPFGAKTQQKLTSGPQSGQLRLPHRFKAFSNRPVLMSSVHALK